MPGKFEVYKDKAGGFRFRLKAANGQNILSSEGYNSKASCLNGVESVKFRFNLTASNGQVVGTSQSYASQSGCNNGMKSVAQCSPGASTDDQT
jgi:uncharacterized protein YegP (UPF0339 family)